jgi:DNA-binding PadR family transcriptional regulator
MSLEHVLLGMLPRPASGYDLRRMFTTGTKFFWSAELSQLYPALERREQRGWLQSRKLPPDKGPPRRVYERTSEGREELLRWLAQGPQLETQRLAYVGQLLFLHEVGDLSQTLGFMQKLRDQLSAIHRYLGDALQATCPAETDPATLPSEELHAWLALGLGTAAMQARLDWCDRAAEVLRRRLAMKSNPPPRSESDHEHREP